MESYCNNNTSNTRNCHNYNHSSVYHQDLSQSCHRHDRTNDNCNTNYSCKQNSNCDSRHGSNYHTNCNTPQGTSCNMNCNSQQSKHYYVQHNNTCNTNYNYSSNECMKKMHDKNLEMECVCHVNSTSDCHKHDEMEHLGCKFPVVMAYVPWQQWGDLYELECGLMQGTIFKDLNFIFCGERC